MSSRETLRESGAGLGRTSGCCFPLSLSLLCIALCVCVCVRGGSDVSHTVSGPSVDLSPASVTPLCLL